MNGRATTAEKTRKTEKTEKTATRDRTIVTLLVAAAWAAPGAAHLWLGRRQKGLIFLAALPVMFAIGLLLDGRLFSFEPSQPLVALAAIADVGLGVPYLIAKLAGFGPGSVVSATYEYGNAFLIVAGLLNFLVMLDAYDIAWGRK
jgi:hypothetical protein